jgi:hypothetical protein
VDRNQGIQPEGVNGSDKRKEVGIAEKGKGCKEGGITTLL